jgi:MinD superfamily P-loop ATPase
MSVRSNAWIAVASGKGGTGKTTVSVNLARTLGTELQLVDLDVEEPNAHLFLGGRSHQSEVVSLPVPEVDPSLCDGCGTCVDVCEYNAIAMPRDRPLVFGELCHGCGGCVLLCPRKAMREVKRRIGVVERTRIGPIELIEGRLDVGQTVAVPLIREVTARLRADIPAVLDAPPGTSCPVIAAVRPAAAVLLVTEPTAFGLHDLALAVEMVRALGRPFGVVVNRVGVGDGRVHAYCEREAIPILGEIPDDRRIAEAYSRGEVAVEALPEYRSLFSRLLDRAGEMLRRAA